MAVLMGAAEDLPPMTPFDAASDVPETEQKELAMRKVNALLRRNEMAEGASLFR